MHVYTPGTGTDSPQETNFDVNRKALSPFRPEARCGLPLPPAPGEAGILKTMIFLKPSVLQVFCSMCPHTNSSKSEGRFSFKRMDYSVEL